MNADTEIKRVVLLEMRSDARPSDIDAAFAGVRALPSQVEGVLEAVAGADVSIDGLAGGYTHGAVLRFADPDTRERYEEHPAHVALAEAMEPLTARLLIVDLVV